MLEVGAVAVELTALRSLGGRGCPGAGLGDAASCHSGERKRNRQRARELQASTHALLLLDDRANLRHLVRNWESFQYRRGKGLENGP